MGIWNRPRSATLLSSLANRPSASSGDCSISGRNFLKVLVDPEEPNIDVIAVHGLNPLDKPDHGEATWTVGDKLWLRDFLPNRAPRARICIFGYNSNVAFGSAAAGVREQAEHLLNQLERLRIGQPDRPLIFICHSLGGIVVKRALVHAKSDTTYEDIWKSTYGIVFFGTPHNGADSAKIGNVVAKITRSILQRPGNTFIKALTRDSSVLNTITDDFRQLLEDFQIISFWETLPLGRFGLVVDPRSAVLGLPGTREKQVPLDADHRSMCKFESEEDCRYQLVASNITDMIEQATLGERQPRDLDLASNQSSIKGESNTAFQAGQANYSRTNGVGNETHQFGNSQRSEVDGGNNTVMQASMRADEALRLAKRFLSVNERDIF
ncbi:hypothetical protein F5Y19DRAFT_413884 [Xylariaceae sp. FL1651]|nr:hypothetical protein F5Y19DRAFT_413884 [Xylariaceae sp. FL1651]